VEQLRLATESLVGGAGASFGRLVDPIVGVYLAVVAYPDRTGGGSLESSPVFVDSTASSAWAVRHHGRRP